MCYIEFFDNGKIPEPSQLKRKDMKKLEISRITPKCLFLELSEPKTPIERSKWRLDKVKGQRSIILDFENPGGIEVQYWISHNPLNVITKIIKSPEEYKRIEKGFMLFLKKSIVKGEGWETKF